MMKIRNAIEQDLPQIVEIYNAAVPSRTATADTEPVSVESKKTWFFEHSPDKYPIWVLETNEEIAGWLSLQPFYKRPAYNSTAEVSIYLDEKYRGQGLGKKLLSEAITRCPQLEITALLAFVFAHNLPSLALFKQYRFQQWGYLPGIALLDDIEKDLVILGLKVTGDDILYKR